MDSIYLIPDVNNINKSITLAEKYNANFEYNDFFSPEILNDKDKYNKMLRFYKGLKRNNATGDTLHGPFMDIAVFSHDSAIRDASSYRVRQSINTALELGCKGIVFHTNYVPNFLSEEYYDSWIEKNAEFWSAICSEYQNISVFMENMFDNTPFPLLKLAQLMQNYPNFGVCLDCGHAFLSDTPVSEWINCLSPFIKHLHFSDNNGLYDMHMQIGTGVINWLSVSNSIKEHNIHTGVLIEVSDTIQQEKSISFIAENYLYPY